MFLATVDGPLSFEQQAFSKKLQEVIASHTIGKVRRNYRLS
jgi:hypothetical protein